MSSEQRASLLQLNVAVLLFAGTALFSHLLPLSADLITFYRVIVAACVLCILMLYQKQTLSFASKKDYVMVTVLGILVGVHWVTYFDGMQRAGVGIGMLAFFTHPIFAVLIDSLFIRKRPSGFDLIMACWIIFGVVLIVPELNLTNNTSVGVAIGVISGFLFALRNCIQHRYCFHHGGSRTMLYQMTVAAIMLACWVDLPVTSTLSNETMVKLIILGSLFTAVPHMLFANALRYVPSIKASMITCLQPLYGIVLAAIILNEPLSPKSLIGGTLIVSAALIVAKRQAKHD